MDSLVFIYDAGIRVKASTIVLYSFAELSKKSKADELIRELSRFDESTYVHCYNVAKLSVAIGSRLKFNDAELHELSVSGIFHDVGKIDVGINIINKKGKLTSDEFREVKRHPLIGYRKLKDLGFSRNILRGVLEHHEKWSGGGYPLGKREYEISLSGRILAIADVFDALTSERPYHKAISGKEAISMMEDSDAFDKDLLAKLIEMLDLEETFYPYKGRKECIL